MPALTFDDLVPAGGKTEDGRTKLRVGAAPSSQALSFDDIITPKSLPAQAGEFALGAGKAVVSGLDKGVAGLAGLPADAALGAQWLVNQGKSLVQGRPFEEVEAESDRNAIVSRDAVRAWGGKAAHEGSPLRHEPQNRTEKYIQSAAEFVPSALIPGASIRNAVTLGVLPGLASEGAGHATEGSPAEPYARGAAALAAGGAGVWFNAPNSAGAAVSRAARGANQAQLDDAERLFQEAQQRGVPITRAEAIQHVTGGATNMGNLQRVIEGSGELRPFFAQRPAQVEAAARREFDQTLGPNARDPDMIGRQLGQTAEGIVKDAERLRSTATAPYYRAAAQETVPEAQIQGLVSQIDSAIAADKTGIIGQKLGELRSLLVDQPAIPPTAATPAQRVAKQTPAGNIYTSIPGSPGTPGRPETYLGDIENLDRVRKYLRDKVGMPQIGADAITKEQAGAILAQLDDLRSSMVAASPNFAAGKQLHQDITRKYVEPLMAGPIGKLAARDATTERAITVLFPENPIPNSQGKIAQAVTALSNRSPGAARQVVRAHVEQTFNEAVQRLQSGANEFGGAGFVAVLRGNPQQAANFEAAMTALRGGQAYQGMDRFLQILEAQGTRQRIGSQTAFNQEVQAGLKEGGTVASALTGAATGGFKVPQQVRDAIQRWRLGENVGQIADLMTNPAAAGLFRQLAAAPANSAKAAAITARLSYMATQDARARE